MKSKINFIMRLSIKTFCCSLIILIFSCQNNNSASELKNKNNNSNHQSSESKIIPDGLRKLAAAYPDFLDSADENNLYWKDGTVMVYDDGKEYTDFEAQLDNADLKDKMSQEYKAGREWDMPPAVNWDPGRIRNEEFFRKMYGNSAGEVQQTLVPVRWPGGRVMITSVNGANERLQQVSDELEQLPAEFRKYFTKTAGTFNYRVIAGTNRLTMLSF